jgi:hypothetical protein
LHNIYCTENSIIKPFTAYMMCYLHLSASYNTADNWFFKFIILHFIKWQFLFI